MSKGKTLKLSTPKQSTAVKLPDSLLDRYQPLALEGQSDILVFGVIGGDFFGEGVTDVQVSAQLKDREGPITVDINSPGGDFFQGVAIYNMLREYEGEVTVRVLGIAASAASLIAMAGDRIEMAEGSEMMIHNSIIGAIGNRHDHIEVAEFLESADAKMAAIYAERSGVSGEKVSKYMDEETFFTAKQAVDLGFADDMTSRAKKVEAAKKDDMPAARRIEHAIKGKIDLTNSEIRQAIAEIKGTPDAAQDPVTPDADEETEWAAAIAVGLLHIQS